MPKSQGAYDTRVDLQECWSIKTGFMKKHELMETKNVGTFVFVQLTKRSQWLCRAVADRAASERPLHRTSVLEELKASVQTENSESPLPMDDKKADDILQDLRQDTKEDNESDAGARGGGPSNAEGKGHSRKRRRSVPAPAVVYTVTIPRLAPQLHPTSAETLDVHVLSDGRNIWLRLDALPWLLQFLRDQYVSGGVTVPSRTSNEEVADGISWDFRDRAWQGVAKDRPAGTSYIRFCG